MLTAQAEAEKIRFVGEAEAASIEAVGKAEAEKMRLKAEAYQQYGEAAKTALVLEALPKVSSTRWGCSCRSSPGLDGLCMSRSVRVQSRFLLCICSDCWQGGRAAVPNQ